MTLTQATWNCAKVVLAITLPIQVMMKSKQPGNTHNFCNCQAIEILRKDGFRKDAELFNTYLATLNRGSAWSDKGFKNISHYYNYQENSGLWNGPDAPTECRFYYQRALKYWRLQRPEKAFFYLGAASHILQDLCVPHHAGGLVLSGHKFFEDWARDHYHDYAVHSEGIYNISGNSGDWVKKNAKISAAFLPHVLDDSKVTEIEKIVGLMLKQAQRTTAGFFHFFLADQKV